MYCHLSKTICFDKWRYYTIQLCIFFLRKLLFSGLFQAKIVHFFKPLSLRDPYWPQHTLLELVFFSWFLPKPLALANEMAKEKWQQNNKRVNFFGVEPWYSVHFDITYFLPIPQLCMLYRGSTVTSKFGRFYLLIDNLLT